MRFSPEYKDLCHHAEQLLSLRVGLFQPAGSETKQHKNTPLTPEFIVKLSINMPEIKLKRQISMDDLAFWGHGFLGDIGGQMIF